jgi:hypothetical protein
MPYTEASPRTVPIIFSPPAHGSMALKISSAAAVQIPLRAPVVAFGAALPAAPLYPQKASNWCWLAVAQMVTDTPPRAIGLSQCSLAVKYIPGAAGCCTGISSSCDQPGGPVPIGQIYTDNGLSYSVSPTAALEATVQAALANGYLVEIGWQTASLGHVVLVVGTHVDARGNNRYSVNDPSPPNVGQIRNLDFAGLANPPLISTGGGPWRWTYTWTHIH